MHMRIDLSREEETKMLPSNSVELVSMNTFQGKLVERIGCRAQPKTYESIKEFLEFIFENVEQFLPESKDEENKVLSDEFVSSELCLEQRLIKFDNEVIRKECPNTPEDHRLLRPEMLEMLLKKEPTTLIEFGERIPKALRSPMKTIHPKHPDCQYRFIKDVVNIIDEYGEK